MVVVIIKSRPAPREPRPLAPFFSESPGHSRRERVPPVRCTGLGALYEDNDNNNNNNNNKKKKNDNSSSSSNNNDNTNPLYNGNHSMIITTS